MRELRPTDTGTLADDVVYGTFDGFFVFVRAEKTKKRGIEGEGGGVMAVDAGAELKPGRGIGGGMPAVFLAAAVVLMAWRGSFGYF